MARQPASPAPLSAPHRVLLVDPDAEIRRMYSTWLSAHLCVVDEAGDGREALAKAVSLRPDVLVTELKLDGINGVQLCELLRNDRDTRETPIVVVPGEGRGPELQRAREVGADVVLTKPCLPEVLLTEIQRLRSHARASSQQPPRAGRPPVVERIRESAGMLGSKLRGSGALSRSYHRYETATPPLPPPQLVCPVCLRPLQYQRSYVGGVNPAHSEQWDYMRCPAGCGEFQYRHRTRKLSKAGGSA